jgi:hypothetical protein
MKVTLVTAILIAVTFARPQNDLSEEAVNQVIDLDLDLDLTSAIKSKTGAVTFIGGSAAEVAVNFTGPIFEAVSSGENK